MRRVIAEIQPTWVVAENVPGIIGMALDDVLSDLEAEGYETGTLVLPACAVNAPHRRNRVWIVAHASSERLEKRQVWPQRIGAVELERSGVVAHTNSDEYQRKIERGISQENGVSEINRTNDNSSWRTCRTGSLWESSSSNVSNTDQSGLERRLCEGVSECSSERIAGSSDPSARSQYGGWQSKSSVGFSDDGLPTGLAGGPEWWDGDWERGIPRVTTSIQQRSAKLKALGNSIVPQVAYQILVAINSLSL